MIIIYPTDYDDVKEEWQYVFLAFSVIRILLFLYFGIINLAQFIYEMLAPPTTRSFTRQAVYLMCTLMSLTRTAAFVMKTYKLVSPNYEKEVNTQHFDIGYDSLIIVGTYSIMIQWCAIGSFWMSTFYVYFGVRSDRVPKVSRWVSILIRSSVVFLTVWVTIIVILTISLPSRRHTINLIYNVIYLFAVLLIGLGFSFHGYVLTRALKRDMERYSNPSKIVVLSFQKTRFLFKVLVVITVVAIVRSLIFGLLIEETFAAVAIGDTIAMIVEIAQMTAVMLTVSLGTFKPFILFKRAFSALSIEEIDVMCQASVFNCLESVSKDMFTSTPSNIYYMDELNNDSNQNSKKKQQLRQSDKSSGNITTHSTTSSSGINENDLIMANHDHDHHDHSDGSSSSSSSPPVTTTPAIPNPSSPLSSTNTTTTITSIKSNELEIEVVSTQ